MRLTLFLLLSLFTTALVAQNESQPPATPAAERIEGYQKHLDLEKASIVNGVEFSSIGPTVFSGRVSEIDVSPKDPSHFYVGYSSGGLFKTENNGITFTPLFDDEMVMTIGDIAVDWDRDIIWIGTGEVNSSRSSYSGTGIFKSFDGGKTWEHAGLEESHHIGRIILHPSNPDIAWVAVLGHLYSPSEERGVFKTTDGGKTWNKTLYVNENAGAVDMVINPLNPDELYAATWERTRRSWNFVESGEGSGIYKSSDAGVTWELLTTKEAGFPVGEGAGRIGLALHEDQGKVTLYASIDNYFRRPPEADKDEDILTKDDLRDMSKTDFLALDKKKIQAYLSSNRFPRKYSVDNVISMVKKDEIQPVALVEYIEDANSLLFGTSVVGLEVYRSDDMGKSWSKTHDGYLNSVYNSYGYYFGQIRVAPYDVNKIYIMGVPIIRSDDGGKTFQSINGDNVHSDHHALWINPNRPGHLINGNDGGINISYDDGENWSKCNTPAVGQFYYIAVDMAEPYNVYGGLQDNGVWMGPNTYRTGSTSWHGSGRYPYQRIMGGDGMQVAIDTRDNATVYTGFQFGNYFRINTKTGENMRINIRHQLGERPLRWNWQTPVHLSIHNQDILYMGANKVFRSMNQAETFEPISEDLTTGGKKGDVAFSTLSTIHESPLKFGLLYVGSDDGLVHVSKNGGSSWEKITAGLPEDMWVSRIQASMHDKGTVYVVLNGYRWDDFTPYLYKSTDYGKSWIQMGKDLPMEPLNVVKEDPKNPNILYVGSDHGLYVSLDGGASFMLMNNKMPAAPVHDVVIHPTTGDILVGTHGRSIYKGRGVELQQLDEEILAMDVHAFKMDNMRASGFWGMSNAAWRKPSSPSTHIPVYAKNAGKATVSIKHGDLILNSMDVDCNKGLNYLEYDLTFDPSNKSKYEKALNEKRRKGSPEIKLKEATNKKMYLKRGDYTVVVAMNGELSETTLSLK